MCPEVFELVKNMDLSNVEVRLALQCAPVIMGIKISNLLTLSSPEAKQVKEILKETGIHHYCLVQYKRKSVYLLYRIEDFEAYLRGYDVTNLLRKLGYINLSTIEVVKEFQNRYRTYMKNGMVFPHELGILLGYPIEDVEGFIENKGENYLYAGYWKVYQDVEEKKLLFDAYESAKEGLLLLVAHGYSMRSIIGYIYDNFVY